MAPSNGMAPAPPRRLRVALGLVLAGLACLPLLAVALLIQRYGGHLPLEDQWDTPGRLFQERIHGTLDWQLFFVQHNEARKAFSNCAWLLLAFDGWNVRLEMYATVFLCALCVVCGFLLARRARPGSNLAAGGLAVLASVLLFSPIGFTGDPLPWLWGVNLENAIVIAALVGGVTANVLLRPWTPRYLIAIVCSLAATYSFANGMLLWVLLHPRWMLVRARADRPATRPGWWLDGLYVALFALVVGTYFHGYFKPPSFPPFSVALQRPDQVALFYLAWIGGPLSPRPLVPEQTSLVGGVAVALFVVALVGVLRRGLWARAFPFIVLGAYVLISAGAVSLGRSTFGLGGASASRYYLHVLVFYLGLNGLLWLAWGAGSAWRGPLGRLALALVVGLQLVSVGRNWHVIHPGHIVEFHERNARGEAALRFVRLIPDNPDLLNLHGLMPERVGRYQLLRREGVLKIDDVPGRQRLAIEDRALTVGAPLIVVRGEDRIRLRGQLDPGPEAARFTHLVVEARSGEERKYVSVLPVPILSREQPGERRRVDVWIKTDNFPAEVSELRLLGYDPQVRRLVPFEPTFALGSGEVEAHDVIALAGRDVRIQSGLGRFYGVCGIGLRDRDELPIPAGVALEFSGWAIDPLARRLGQRVFVRAGERLFPALYHLPRPDVATHLGSPTLLESGFTCRVSDELLGADRSGPFHIVLETWDGELLESPFALRVRRVERGAAREDGDGR